MLFHSVQTTLITFDCHHDLTPCSPVGGIFDVGRGQEAALLYERLRPKRSYAAGFTTALSDRGAGGGKKLLSIAVKYF
ncbi:hypothetical protein WKK05_06210 [Nostoc sp. UHCC 0302]|uniref:hypothetical protein n=1 Tax=Nostoc sp. UHCC 0302 TaxID=3134896 RepID=UPI00311CC810